MKILRTAIVVMLVFTTSRASTAQDEFWNAGVSRRVITPKTSVWLAGYGTRRVPQGKLHDLWMKALALASQN